MTRRLICVAAVAVTLILGPSAGHTSDSFIHGIVGSGAAGSFTVAGLAAYHYAPTGSGLGTALINDVVVVFTCVHIQLGATNPLVHRARLAGTGGGSNWYITITTVAVSSTLSISNFSSGDPCGTGGSGQGGSGRFVIAP